MKYYYVYVHICLPDTKIYIGWSGNPKQRWFVHCAAKDNSYFHRAIRKYGKECFEMHILFKTTNLKEVRQKEKDFIKQFNTQAPNGYNMTEGGDGSGGYWKGKKRPNISKSNRRRKGEKHPNFSGVKNPMYGRKNPKGSRFQGHKHSKKSNIKRSITCMKKAIKNLEKEI